MGFYDDMQGAATDLLGEFNQGECVLKRVTVTPPANDWEEGTETVVEYPLKAAVSRVSQKYVDGSTIIATDDMMTLAVPEITPLMTDIFTVDGRERVVKDIRPMPAAGTVCAYIVFLAA